MFESPDTREVDEGYNPEHDCRTCVNLVHEDGRYRCQLNLLGRTYRVRNSLKGTYPQDVAAACKSYVQRDSTFGKEG
jgi:hypothetical protein